MQESNNLWKATKVIENAQAKPIMTIIPTEPLVESDYDKLTKLAEIERATEPYRQQLITEAQIEAKIIKEKAQQEGANLGYEAGYAEGKLVGDQMANQINAEAQTNFLQTQTEIASYVKDKQDEIISIAVSMASALINKKLELEPTIINAVIEPMLQKLIEPDILITITANPNHHQHLVELLNVKKNEIPSLRFIILDDMQMALVDVKVETRDTVMQIDMQKELAEFLEVLQKVDTK